MFGLGTTELIIILILVLVIFGAGKLPEIGGALGKGLRSFKKATQEPDEIDVTPKEEDKEEQDKK
ncbi:twin-arginine translocase TatA/TatE family subunit [Desulfuromonas sp. TF]|jgi:sec-independent protein translocase protein TatA|uniref:twin-arginine translocase TatA/TatE family subunit n=1 Tax=Desulfuromonas sp. TF TaxID=1232410 RepID=UPI0003FDBC40|nr:twin-arginine translocase TatA/TatE family subunit [Desulfuromonas sp. TF]